MEHNVLIFLDAVKEDGAVTMTASYVDKRDEYRKEKFEASGIEDVVEKFKEMDMWLADGTPVKFQDKDKNASVLYMVSEVDMPQFVWYAGKCVYNDGYEWPGAGQGLSGSFVYDVDCPEANKDHVVRALSDVGLLTYEHKSHISFACDSDDSNDTFRVSYGIGDGNICKFSYYNEPGAGDILYYSKETGEKYLNLDGLVDLNGILDKKDTGIVYDNFKYGFSDQTDYTYVFADSLSSMNNFLDEHDKLAGLNVYTEALQDFCKSGMRSLDIPFEEKLKDNDASVKLTLQEKDKLDRLEVPFPEVLFDNGTTVDLGLPEKSKGSAKGM